MRSWCFSIWRSSWGQELEAFQTLATKSHFTNRVWRWKGRLNPSGKNAAIIYVDIWRAAR